MSDARSLPTPVLFNSVGAMGAILTCSRSVDGLRDVGGRARDCAPKSELRASGDLCTDDAECERDRDDAVTISNTSSSSSSESDPITLSLKYIDGSSYSPSYPSSES